MQYTVRKILQENWKNYLKEHKVTDYQRKEIEKAINCSKHSCNSRICSNCGKRYSDQWSNQLQKRLFPIDHKHIVLTVPAVLRPKLRDWNKLKSVIDVANSFLSNILILTQNPSLH